MSDMEHLISPDVLGRTAAIRADFQGAKPFKHVCIEDFFPRAYVEQLLKEFPPFDTKDAINEFGLVGGKAVKTDLRNIGPAYDKLYSYLSSPLFLDAMSEMLGIPDLLFDPAMYGGGTHENLPGQELDPHVDFNYDQGRNAHRRVNLLVYLNPEWDEAWGGAIELHSNPRDWEHNQVKTFNCTFNRCVVFETNEYSWHGFKRIAPPRDKGNLTRKCISIYLYTKDRPKEEIAPLHGTFYVQRPLPDGIVAGHTLDSGEVAELKSLMRARDHWIKFYQDLELRLSHENTTTADYVRELLSLVRLPSTGYIMQKQGSLKGAYADGWVSSQMEVTLMAAKALKGLSVRGWIPDSYAPGMRLRASLAGKPAGEIELKPGREFEWKLKLPRSLSGEVPLSISTENLVKAGVAGDGRDLSFILTEIRAEH